MRPEVHVNFAMTLDACIGGPGRTPLRISNEEDLRRVHRLRSESDAILVGVGTVLADDPKLTVKWELAGRTGRPPLRVVLDGRLRTPRTAQVVSSEAPTLLFTAPDAPDRNGWALERVPATKGRLHLPDVLDRLGERGIRRLLVEGGAQVLTSFFTQDLVDAATLFIAPRTLGAPDAPRFAEAPLDLNRRLKLSGVEVLGDGLLVSWNRRG